ncbi:acyl-CoA dehydrogenase [Burkholderia sp. ABCPW 11]|uniref:acyl-CoA dehydrogenase n=1 Tax=Burkholderia sp. ABCPW 11 TaxID=1637859 RepID=UPI000AADD6D3|nr:acyl-CoA dehydrogenase [Burkholderia sp. ABCPW 11]
MNAYQLENGGISGSPSARPTIAPEIDEIRDTLSGLTTPDHRRLLIQLLSSADFDKPLDRHSVDLHRSTYDRLVKLAGRLPAAAGNLSDPSLLSAIAEWTAVNDPSLCIAALIHYGLCIGSLVELGKGNARAQEYASELAAGRKVGAFMITEIGGGNSQLATRVEARFDAASRSFVLHTPDDGALKFTNVGVNDLDKLGIVCARVIVDERDCGVFAFAVDLSTREGPLPGVRLSAPAEIPLVPFDYGLAGFDRVRVPFDAWLADGASIDTDGRFHDPLGDPNGRLVRTLTAPENVWAMGAIGLAAVSRTCVAQALRYSTHRSSMARIAPETSLMRYSTQQRALLRALATSYVMTCFANEAAREWALALHGRAQPDRTASSFMMWAPWSSTNRKLALVKALTAWAAEEVAAECRLRCGVAGDLLVNRYLDYQGLGHVFNDAGGNNFLILLDTARTLAAAPAASAGSDEGGSNWPAPARDAIAALRARERRLIRSLADQVDDRTASGVDSLDVWNPLLPRARDAAEAYGLNLALDAALAAADAVASEPARALLRDLAALFAIDRAQRHGGWLISEGVMDPSGYRQLDAATDALCARLVPHVDTFVEAFGHPHPVVRSPISDPTHDYAASLARMLRVPPGAPH